MFKQVRSDPDLWQRFTKLYQYAKFLKRRRES